MSIRYSLQNCFHSYFLKLNISNQILVINCSASFFRSALPAERNPIWKISLICFISEALLITLDKPQLTPWKTSRQSICASTWTKVIGPWFSKARKTGIGIAWSPLELLAWLQMQELFLQPVKIYRDCLQHLLLLQLHLHNQQL